MKWLTIMFGLWLVAVLVNNYIKQMTPPSKPVTFHTVTPAPQPVYDPPTTSLVSSIREDQTNPVIYRF